MRQPPPVQPDAAIAAVLADRLREALGVSQHMLQSAAAGDWSRVVLLETQRAGLLDEPTLAACGALPPDLRADIAPLLSRCVCLNDELVELTAIHLRDLSEALILQQVTPAAEAELLAPQGGGV